MVNQSRSTMEAVKPINRRDRRETSENPAPQALYIGAAGGIEEQLVGVQWAKLLNV